MSSPDDSSTPANDPASHSAEGTAAADHSAVPQANRGTEEVLAERNGAEDRSTPVDNRSTSDDAHPTSADDRPTSDEDAVRKERLERALRKYRATLRNEAESGNEGFSAEHYRSQKPPHW